MTTSSVLITGASSGIGKALAFEYAAPGVHLALTGRNSERLEAVASECRTRGAEVRATALDVCDRLALTSWINEIDASQPLDLGIACAGILYGTGLDRARELPSAIESIVKTNILGTINTAEALADCMSIRGSGQLAIVGSLAGYRGFPFSAVYCASKAAVQVYAEGLRANLRSNGVGVTLIAPGFVASNFVKGVVSPKPLMVQTEKAARLIRVGLDRRKNLIAFPQSLYIGVQLMRLLPSRLIDNVLSRVKVDIPN